MTSALPPLTPALSSIKQTYADSMRSISGVSTRTSEQNFDWVLAEYLASAAIVLDTVEALDELPVGSVIFINSHSQEPHHRIKKWNGLWLGDSKDRDSTTIDSARIIHWYARATLISRG